MMYGVRIEVINIDSRVKSRFEYFKSAFKMRKQATKILMTLASIYER